MARNGHDSVFFKSVQVYRLKPHNFEVSLKQHSFLPDCLSYPFVAFWPAPTLQAAKPRAVASVHG